MKIILKKPCYGLNAGDTLQAVSDGWKLGEVKVTMETIRARGDVFEVQEEEKSVDGDEDVELLKNMFGM